MLASQVSVGQLRWLFKCHEESPYDAIAGASWLLRSREHDDGVPPFASPQFMSAFGWLTRAGLGQEQYVFALEEAGYTYATSFAHFKEKDLKETCKMNDKGHLARCVAILEHSKEHPDLLLGFELVDKARARLEFLRSYPAHT